MSEQFRQRERAESFGTVADDYDRFRPSYPAALIDDLMALAPRSVLDVACGTGKAARLLAARGLDVLGVEVDERMAAVARRHGIAVEVGGFETWDDAGRTFDLITCGQAWHWLEPTVAIPKAARLLRPNGGTLALFWNYDRLDEPAQRALDEVYQRLAPELGRSVVLGSGRQADRPHAEALRDSGRFADVQERAYAWEHSYPTADWVALVQTHSDHLQLPAPRRAELVSALRSAIDALGGAVASHYTTHAVFARAPG